MHDFEDWFKKTGLTSYSPKTIGKGQVAAWQYAHDIDGWTSLTQTILQNDIRMAQRCLKKGADVNARDRFGRPMLLLAAEYNQGEMVKFLLDHGADAHTTGTADRAPLHAAVAWSNLEMVNALIKHGADVNDRAWDNRTPWNVADDAGNKAVAEALVRAGAVPRKIYPQPSCDCLRAYPLYDPDHSTEVYTSPGYESEPAQDGKAPVDPSHYRIVMNAYGQSTAGNNLPPNDVADGVYHLFLPGRKNPIYLDSSSHESVISDCGHAHLKWLEEGSLLDVSWKQRDARTGTEIGTYHLVLLVQGCEIKPVFRAWPRWDHRAQKPYLPTDQVELAWNKQTQELNLTRDQVDEEQSDQPILFCSAGGKADIDSTSQHQYQRRIETQSIWRYRVRPEDSSMYYAGGEIKVLGLAGRPCVDVACYFSITMEHLVSMNPFLKNQIFCDRILLVNNAPPDCPEVEWFYPGR